MLICLSYSWKWYFFSFYYCYIITIIGIFKFNFVCTFLQCIDLFNPWKKCVVKKPHICTQCILVDCKGVLFYFKGNLHSYDKPTPNCCIGLPDSNIYRPENAETSPSAQKNWASSTSTSIFKAVCETYLDGDLKCIPAL